MVHKLLLLYSWFVKSILFFLPDYPLFMRFRGFLYSLVMKSAGKNFQVAHNAILLNLETISVGDNCYIAYFSILIANPKGAIILDDEVQIGPHCVVVSDNHTSINHSFRYGKCHEEQIILGRGSWVGANSIILKGSILPSGSVLGAGSVLNKKFEIKNSLYAGSPAKLIKNNL